MGSTSKHVGRVTSNWQLVALCRFDAGTLVYRCNFRSVVCLEGRSLTWPVGERAHGGWSETLPRPAPSAVVPVDNRIEHMCLLCQGELCIWVRLRFWDCRNRSVAIRNGANLILIRELNLEEVAYA